MTDDMSRLGEPVGEPTDEATPANDVVVSAQEGLAEAQAAGAEVGAVDATAPGAENVPTATTDASPDEDEAFAARYAGFTSGEGLADAPRPEEAGGMETQAASTPADAVVHTSEPATPGTADAAGIATVAAAGAVVAPTEQLAAPYTAPDAAAYAPTPEQLAAAAAVQQPIFVQAPLPPTPRGNRGVGALIGLLAAASFAVLYLAAYLCLGLISGEFTFANIGTAAQGALVSVWLWVATAVFYLAFLVFVAIANRARWGIYVILGLLIGLASYGGHVVGQLFQAPFWSLTASQGVALVESQLVAPLAFIAFVIGRELTIWFGAWIAMHGRRATEYNREALLEYERTLEAGPTLTRV